MPAAAGGGERLIILGCGFGGYGLLAGLRRDLFRVTVVSPVNYFLFTPLLPSAVSGAVEFRSILEPVRRRFRHVRLLEAEAVGIDFAARRVDCRGAIGGEPFALSYDRLVLAVGAAVGDHGVAGVREHATTLAGVDDGRRIRRELLARFARAGLPGLAESEVERLLTFVVCGGGPTGVEVAAEISDLLHRELRWLHPQLAPRARVVLLEARGRLLSGFDEALSRYARRQFLREGIEVQTSAPVAAIEEGRVVLAGDGGSIPAGLVIWAGGAASRPLVAGLGLPLQGGRLPVDGRLRLAGAGPGVYALGDCAALGDPPLPATAQVAQSQGRWLAGALRREAAGRPVGEFTHRSLGMLAYVGGGRALADLPGVKWSGRAAWLFWKSVYLTKLVSFANKVKVLLDWIKARLLGRDLSRL